MKRGQRVLPLKLFDNMASKVDDALHLRVLWHLPETQSCFCHCGDGSIEDWIRGIVEFIVEVARGKRARSAARALHSPLY